MEKGVPRAKDSCSDTFLLQEFQQFLTPITECGMPTPRWALYEVFTISSLIYPSTHHSLLPSIYSRVCTHPHRKVWRPGVDIRMSFSIMPPPCFFVYVCVYVRVCAHACDQRTAGRVSSCLLQPRGPCKPSF